MEKRIKKSLIRPLIPSLIRKFKLNKELCDTIHDLMTSTTLLSKIGINNEVNCNRLAYYDEEHHEIIISENFLCYLWTACHYCITTVFLGILKEEKTDSDITMIHEAEDIYTWGKGLKYGYYEYSSEWITPECKNDHILLVNILFSYAVEIVLCHELAHIKLGHKAMTISAEQEIEADEFALHLVQKELKEFPENKKSLFMGSFIGYCAMILFEPQANADMKVHPASLKRARTTIEKLDIEPDSEIWLLVCFVLFAWNASFGKNYILQNEGVTYKDLFYNMYAQETNEVV